jgi:hypothetical protein
MLVYKCDACDKVVPKRNDAATLAVGFGSRIKKWETAVSQNNLRVCP